MRAKRSRSAPFRIPKNTALDGRHRYSPLGKARDDLQAGVAIRAPDDIERLLAVTAAEQFGFSARKSFLDEWYDLPLSQREQLPRKSTEFGRARRVIDHLPIQFGGCKRRLVRRIRNSVSQFGRRKGAEPGEFFAASISGKLSDFALPIGKEQKRGFGRR